MHASVELVTSAVTKLYISSDEAIKLAIGPALGLISSDLKVPTPMSVPALIRSQAMTTKSKKQHKLCLYSGHDTTILPLLVALDVFDGTWPDFCANLAFELYEVSHLHVSLS